MMIVATVCAITAASLGGAEARRPITGENLSLAGSFAGDGGGVVTANACVSPCQPYASPIQILSTNLSPSSSGTVDLASLLPDHANIQGLQLVVKVSDDSFPLPRPFSVSGQIFDPAQPAPTTPSFSMSSSTGQVRPADVALTLTDQSAVGFAFGTPSGRVVTMEVWATGWTPWDTDAQEAMLLAAEENAEVSDAEVEGMIASSPSQRGDVTESLGGCTVDDPCMQGEIAERSAALAGDSECRTVLSELRWHYRNRYSACRSWNATLVANPGPSEIYVSYTFSQEASGKPRRGEVEMATTITPRGIQSKSGIPTPPLSRARTAIAYRCNAPISCDSSSVSPEGQGDEPHELSTGTLTADVALGSIRTLVGALRVDMAFTHENLEMGRIRNMGQVYGPNMRCDAVQYMKRPGGIDTRGCVMLEYRPVFTLDWSNQKTIYSARHINDAQTIWGFPGSYGRPLHRLRGEGQTKNRNAALAKCRQLKNQRGSCDEYPFAATEEGCSTAGDCSVRRIPLADNSLSGTYLGNFFKGQRVLDGDAFHARVVDK